MRVLEYMRVNMGREILKVGGQTGVEELGEGRRSFLDAN